MPQPPQLASSVATFTQRSLHSMSDVGHRQIPAMQVVPKGHWMSHAPQWFPSFVRFTQRPPQSVVEGGHTGPPSPPLAPLSSSPASRSHALTHSHCHDVVLQRSPGLHPVPRPQTTPAGHSLGTSLPQGNSSKRSGGGQREMHTQRRSVRSQRSPTLHPWSQRPPQPSSSPHAPAGLQRDSQSHEKSTGSQVSNGLGHGPTQRPPQPSSDPHGVSA